MKEKYINQKFKSSMLSAATKTLGFRDMQTDKLYNLAIIHIPNQMISISKLVNNKTMNHF